MKKKKIKTLNLIFSVLFRFVKENVIDKVFFFFWKVRRWAFLLLVFFFVLNMKYNIAHLWDMLLDADCAFGILTKTKLFIYCSLFNIVYSSRKKETHFVIGLIFFCSRYMLLIVIYVSLGSVLRCYSSLDFFFWFCIEAAIIFC